MSHAGGRRTRSALMILAALVLGLTTLVQSVAAAPKPEPRIIGGQPAGVGEYPFMVGLLYEPIEGTDFDKQYCGGSLIAPTWVLTAAHCVDFLESPSEVAVVVARTDLDNTAQGQRRAVSAFFIHPDFDANALSPDVALLQLASPVTGVTPIRLAGAGDNGFEAAGTPLTVIGWGNTDTRSNHASFPNGLREITVPAVSDSACLHVYKRFLVTDTMLCAGQKRADSCQGDSGGPLFAVTSAGVRIQMGVVSWGIGCAKTHFPGVYAEVNSPTIRSFIASTAGV